MTPALEVVFDLLLCATLLWLAWRSVAAPDVMRRVVVFLVFGLLMALVWARLGAPDLALAEAVIGAGVTSALLLGAGVARPAGDGRDTAGESRRTACGLPRALLALLCALAGTGLALVMYATVSTPAQAPPTTLLEEHALGNPVTAVLLDFRGHDTVLELVVLLVAFLGARVLSRRLEPVPVHAASSAVSSMLDQLLAMTTPVLLLVALYVLWAGSDAPGGAFQAGALLAGLGVMYSLAGRLPPLPHTPARARLLLVLGPGVFALFACLSLVWGHAPLTFPAQGVRVLALVIDTALMVSVAVTLVLLFLAAPGARFERGAP